MASKCTPLPPSQARLNEAITDARIFQTKQLLESKVELEFVDEEGLRPLLRVCMIEDAKHRTRSRLLRLLLQHGANVNSTDQQGRHALAWSCVQGKEDIVRLLLGLAYHDIDLNKQDVQGNTPLMQAVKSGNPNIVKLILEALKKYQIDIDVRNQDDRTPYLEAKFLGHEECAEILLKEGKASKTVQVNPFMGQEQLEQERVKGEIRGIEGRQESHVYHRKAGLYTKYPNEDSKRILRRKLASSKRGSANDARNKLRRVQLRRQRAWEESKKTQSSPESERSSGSNEGSIHVEEVMPVSVTMGNVSAQKTMETLRRAPACLSVEAFRVAKPSRPCTAQPYRDDRNKSISSLDLRCAPEKVADKNCEVKRPTDRPKIGERCGTQCKLQRSLRSNSAVSFDCDSVSSWYSHFSVHTTPSVEFLQRLMAIYATQVSPQSSYRNGVAALKARPTIVQPEDDARSEGGRSSVGSTRSTRAASPSLRKFSSLTRSVISSRRAVASITVPPTKVL